MAPDGGTVETKNEAGDLGLIWSREDIARLFDLPLMDLVFRAAEIHRAWHDPNTVQLSQLMSIKTGGCPEDCGYCSQSAKYADATGLAASKLMDVDQVLADARRAKEGGASRYCMGAAWRAPKDRDLPALEAMVKGVKALGLETCMTLGMLEPEQAAKLKQAGLDYYNHNIDTSEEHYGKIITTRSFENRLATLKTVREAGIKVCCGGILGLGENEADRVSMLATLANLDPAPESVPINQLVPIEGTPLGTVEAIDPFDLVRVIAVARITMPTSAVRLSAGRETMDDALQALCFLAGANSIFYGETLLTTPNPENNRDLALFERLGMTPA